MKISKAILAVLVYITCAVNVSTSSQVMAMSEEEEVRLGKEGHKAIMQRYRVYRNPTLQKYVDHVGQKLASKSDRPELEYHFLLLDSEEVNAFAMPGGYIYITRGLMPYLNSEAELAAVLGHEIGHIVERHAARQESVNKLAKAGVTLTAILGAIYTGLDPNVGYNLASIGGGAIVKGYGREHELESDQVGAELLARAGYNPEAMMKVIETLKDQESYEFKLARMEGRKARIYHGLFASHPSSDKRLQEIIERAKTAQTRIYVSSNAGDDPYRELTNGLSYGANVRNGLIRGPNYYHGQLGFAMRFPNRWNIENKTSPITVRDKTNSAAILINVLAADPKLSPEQYLKQRMGINRVSSGQAIKINGLNAYTGKAVINVNDGKRLSRITMIYYGRRAYVITGTSKDVNGINRHDGTFMKTTKSFRPMTREERMTARQQRIKLIQADENTNYKTLAASSPLENLAEEQLRLLNGDYPRGGIEAGDMVKVIQ